MAANVTELARATGATALKVLQGGASSAPPPVGSEAWASALRSNAKTIAKDLEEGYLRLGELLYLAEVTRVGGESTGAPLHTLFGYTTYNAWVTADLGLHERKARSLIRIYRRVGVELKGLDPTIRARLLALGWTKMREVAGVLTVSNALAWAEAGEKHNYADFRAAVSKYADGLQQKAIDDAKAEAIRQAEQEGEGDDPPPPPFTAGADFSSSKPASSKAHAAAASDDAEEGDDEDDGTSGVPIPQPEKTIPFHFALYPDQAQTLRDALKLAEAHNPGKPKSYYLEVLALEYASTYHNGTSTAARRAVTMARLAELYGVEVVVRDPATGELLVGGNGALALALRNGEV